MYSAASTHPLSRLCIIIAQLTSLSLSVLRSMSYSSFLIDFIFNRLSMSSQINAYFGVDPNMHAFASLADCITEPILEEQVLLSSLLPAYHTHTQDLYSQATLCDDGSHCRGCHPSHFSHTLLCDKPLRQHKRVPAFLASCAQWQGRVLKRTTSSSFAYCLTSEQVRSTIIIGVPAFISFVVPSYLPALPDVSLP